MKVLVMAVSCDGEVMKDVNSKLLSLAEKTGYEIMQTNGQRKYGPPPNWNGPPPPKGSEVFVGKLPREVFEDELVPLFETVGVIYELRLMMDFSGTNRGFAFVQFTKPREADRAIKQLDNYQIRPGQFLGVVKSVDNCRLFIGGLPKSKTKEEITKELNNFVEGVKDVIVYSSIIDKKKNRGFAFIEFQNHRAAAMARRRLVPCRIKLWGFDVQIDWAIPEQDVDEATMSKVKILYIRNLTLSTTEDSIRQAMESVSSSNAVDRVKKVRDFAFVHFKDRESAKAAMEEWNNTELNGSIVEVTWAKPVKHDSEEQMQQITHGRHQYMRYMCPGRINYASGYRPPSQVPSYMRNSAPWRTVRTYIPVPSQIYGLRYGARAPQVLSEFCKKHNWGEPYFNVMTVTSQQQEKLYVCKITIPYYPGDQTHFQSHKVSLTTEDARILSAEITLGLLQSVGQSAAYSEGYEHRPVVSAGLISTHQQVPIYPASSGLNTHPEIALAYAYPPNQASGYLVHGKEYPRFPQRY